MFERSLFYALTILFLPAFLPPFLSPQIILSIASGLGLYGGERVLRDIERELKRRPNEEKTLIIDADDDARETVGQQFMQAYFYLGSAAGVVLAIVGFAAAAVARGLPAADLTLGRWLYLGTASSCVTVCVVLAGGTVVVTAAALVLGLLRMRSAAVLVAAAAAGCALPAGVVAGVVAAQVSGDVDPVASAVAGAGVGLALLGTVLAVAIGGGLRRVGAGAAGVMAILLSLLVLALLVAGVGTSAAVGVVGVVAVFATGVLPWVALGSAGLTGLDQRVAEGERLDRATARDRIDDAYSVLTWSTAITSAFATIATVALVLGAPVWSPLLALAIALAGALRSRAFPLRISSAVLWSPLVLGGATAVLALLGGPVGAWGVAVCLLAAAGIAVLALVSPRENTRARLRGLGNALEMLAVVALLPLLFGVFGVYAELLGMFGGGS